MSIRFTFAVLLSAATALGQTVFHPPPAEQRHIPPSGSPLLDPKQPSVYMRFERVAKCPPLFEGELNQRIWLRLKNNTHWPILVRMFGVPDEYGEAGLFYSVEAPSIIPDAPLPRGYWFDVASLNAIEPGDSWTFSVPKNHLDPGLQIRIDFEFAWEKNSRYTRHSSSFSYWDLPSSLHDKQKEKKLKHEFEIGHVGPALEYRRSPLPTVLEGIEPSGRPSKP